MRARPFERQLGDIITPGFGWPKVGEDDTEGTARPAEKLERHSYVSRTQTVER